VKWFQEQQQTASQYSWQRTTKVPRSLLHHTCEFRICGAPNCAPRAPQPLSPSLSACAGRRGPGYQAFPHILEHGHMCHALTELAWLTVRGADSACCCVRPGIARFWFAGSSPPSCLEGCVSATQQLELCSERAHATYAAVSHPPTTTVSPPTFPFIVTACVLERFGGRSVG
jgi:hypothetical protein